MIKVVCFDLFSTLVDVGSVPLSVGRMTADILGMERDVWTNLCFSAQHEICQPTVASDVIRSLVHHHDSSIPEQLIQQASAERQWRFDYALKEHIQDDVLEGISALKQQGYRLVLVSNASTAEVQAWSHSPLAKYFEHAIFSCAVGLKKPDRTIYEHASKQIGVPLNECLFVGDGGSDELVGAKQVGMAVLLMTRFLKNKKAARLESYFNYIDGDVESTSDVLDWLVRQKEQAFN